MFGILELLHLGVMIGDQVLNIPTLGREDIVRKPEVKVYATEVREQRPMFVSHCTYNGLLVEYTRTWEEERNGTVWPPEPDKPAGFGMILIKGSCPHKEEDAEKTVEFFAIGERGIAGRYAQREMERIVTYPLTPENRDKLTPKWLSQVMDTIAQEAPVNPAAQAFLDEIQRRHAAGLFVHGLPHPAPPATDAPNPLPDAPPPASADESPAPTAP